MIRATNDKQLLSTMISLDIELAVSHSQGTRVVSQPTSYA